MNFIPGCFFLRYFTRNPGEILILFFHVNFHRFFGEHFFSEAVPASKEMSKTTRFEPSLTIQKWGLIELFIIRVKKKNAKPQSSQNRQTDACF
jgi:hypothetical protein